MRHASTRMLAISLAGAVALACGDEPDPAPGPDAAPPLAGDADYTRATAAQRRAALAAARRDGLDGLAWDYLFNRVGGGTGGCPRYTRDGDLRIVASDGCVDHRGRTFRGGYRLDGSVFPLYEWRSAANPYDIDARFEAFEVDDPAPRYHRWFDGALRMSRAGDTRTPATASAALTTRHLATDEPVEVSVTATWQTAGADDRGHREEHADRGGSVDLPGIGRGYIEGSWERVHADITALGTVSLRGQNVLTLHSEAGCEVITIDGAEVERTCH
jgi:hypothetical protein